AVLGIDALMASKAGVVRKVSLLELRLARVRMSSALSRLALLALVGRLLPLLKTAGSPGQPSLALAKGVEVLEAYVVTLELLTEGGMGIVARPSADRLDKRQLVRRVGDRPALHSDFQSAGSTGMKRSP